MPWAKLHETFADHRKFRRVGLEATGLYALTLAYCAKYSTDGWVEPEWFEDQIPGAKRRERILEKLVAYNLLESNGRGYYVHDYLDYNMSREEWERLRNARAKAGSKGGKSKSKGQASA